MFEDSTFESTGRLRTRSRGWMVATFALNTSILLGLILVPLIYPAALPRMALSMLMEAPATPAEEPKPVARPEHTTVMPTQTPLGIMQAPSIIPHDYKIPSGPEVVVNPDWQATGPDGGTGSADNPFGGRSAHLDVRLAASAPAHISTGIMEGMLIHKVMPIYPPWQW